MNITFDNEVYDSVAEYLLTVLQRKPDFTIADFVYRMVEVDARLMELLIERGIMSIEDLKMVIEG